tara:strand:- start:222 stop:488 length:267 start_codon:yes stop_codon:yes gene_type:complete
VQGGLFTLRGDVWVGSLFYETRYDVTFLAKYGLVEGSIAASARPIYDFRIVCYMPLKVLKVAERDGLLDGLVLNDRKNLGLDAFFWDR